MEVTYKLYKNKEQILSIVNTACFSGLFLSSWDKISILVYESEQNKGELKFWTDLIMKIEPKATIDDKNWMTIPYMGKGKTLLILTALRYLWEYKNHYDDIIPMTKTILNKCDNIDPFLAIVLASSITSLSCGWGHSLVLGVTENLPRTWHYRRYKGGKCQGLCHDNSSRIPLLDDLALLRSEKTDRYDVLPILKLFKIPYNEK